MGIIGRRGFLKALGLAPAAASVAAKELAAPRAYSAMLGHGVTGLSTALKEPSDMDAIGAGVNAAKNGPSMSTVERLTKIGDLLKAGVPPHIERKIRRHAEHLRRLDPDLIANRSFSLATKRRIQIEREVARALAEMIDENNSRLDQFLFKESNGLEFYF